jgi:hypothetical protein
MQARQGDIFVEQIQQLPEPLVSAPASLYSGDPVHVLAEGEATGHAHRIAAGPGIEWFIGGPGSTVGWLRLARHALLEHDEHAPLPLSAGCYRVVRQRRYDPRSEEVRWQHAGD